MSTKNETEFPTQRTVRLGLTAEEWKLVAREGDKGAARKINRTIKKGAEGMLDRAEVERLALETMEQLSDFGAMDTEPRRVLSNVLDAIYGKAKA